MKIYKLQKQKIKIDEIEFQKFLLSINQNNSKLDKSISSIWRNVLKIYKIQNDVSKLEINQLINIYSSYYQNGLSDGACAGARMENMLYKIKYFFRELNRLRIIKKIINKKTYINLSLKNLPLSPNVFTGEIWMLKVDDIEIPLEICDHLYFLLTIFEDLKIAASQDKSFLFIGDGSGLLSNLILNLFSVKKAIFLDLPQFLIRQYIVNNEFIEKLEFYTPSNFDSLKTDEYIIINQDSFPEIPKEDLDKYTNAKLIKNKSKIYSYNQKPIDDQHSKWNDILKYNGWDLLFSKQSSSRRKYFLEVYSKVI